MMNANAQARKDRATILREQNRRDLETRRAKMAQTIAVAPPRCQGSKVALQFDGGGIGGRWSYQTTHSLRDVLHENYFITERERFRPHDRIDVTALINAPVGEWECADLVVAAVGPDMVLVIPRGETAPVRDADGRVIGYKLTADEPESQAA